MPSSTGTDEPRRARALDAATCADLVAFLSRGGGPRTWVQDPDGPFIHGPLLAPTLVRPQGPDPAGYARVTASWSLHLADRETALTAAVHGALSSLLGGDVATPPGHAPFSVRVFPPGTESPWHTDNYRFIDAYATLRELTPDAPQLSWIVPLAPHEGGDLEFDDAAEHPTPGEMLLFDGSRTRHRVGPVRGLDARWTLGGFAARGHGGGWWAWS